MDTLLQDVRYAARTLLKAKGFTGMAAVCLALGIGANSAIFAVVDVVLIQPLPYRYASRDVVIWNSYSSIGLERASVSAQEFADIRAQQREFDGVSALADWDVNLTGVGEPERLQGFVVSPDLFRILGVAPALGRGFFAEEGRHGGEHVVVLGNDLWRRRFGSDPHVLGRTLHLNGQSYTVIGVMPAGIRFPDAPSLLFPERAALWVPRAWEQVQNESRGDQYLRVVGRLKPGSTLTRARADLDAIAARFRAQYPEYYPANSGWHLSAVPLRDQIVGDVQPALLLLFGAVGLVLLIACANVANLMLARATTRQTEIAVRMALGADRLRVVRQLLTESTLLGTCGGALGLLLAVWGIEMLVRLSPGDIPRIDQVAINPRVLWFAIGASMLTSVLFGLAPALQRSRQDLSVVLREGGRGSTAGVARHRFRNALVIAEVALSLVVLVGAGLLLRSFVALERVDLGFRTRNVLTMQLSLPKLKYGRPAQAAAFHAELLRRLAALPGVRAVGAARPLPLSGDGWSGSFVVEGQIPSPGEQIPHAEYAAVTPDYFRALSIPLRSGRVFTEHDDVDAPEVVIVDSLLAQRYWPGEDAVGKRINLAYRDDSTWATVVGVVGHVRNAGPHSTGEPQIYVPFFQSPRNVMYVAVRTEGDPLRLVPAVRRELRAIDPDQPIAQMRTMDEAFASSTSRPRFNLLVLSVFAGAALLLAAVGVYGVMSQVVTQRTHEIGVRMALGADARDVRRMIVRQGMSLTLVGVGIGLAAALAVSRVMAGVLFGVGTTDTITYVGITVLLTLVALAAVYLPARYASRVDPLTALRHE